MKRSYLVIEKEGRGELVDIVEMRSELGVEEFCNSLLDKKVERMRKGGVEESFIEEFCGVGRFGNVWEVNWGEGEGYDVYELK